MQSRREARRPGPLPAISSRQSFLSFHAVVLRSGLLGGELNGAHHDALVTDLINTARTGPASGKFGIEKPVTVGAASKVDRASYQ